MVRDAHVRPGAVALREASDEDVPDLARLYEDSVRDLGPEHYRPEAVTAWAREGIGFHLLDAILRHARAEGVSHFRTEASELSRPLFEKFRFVVVGTEVVERAGVGIERFRMELSERPS